MEFFKDLFNFIINRKKLWLIPIIVILLLLSVIIVLVEGTALAPFIYTVF
ncbi:DUF5989 family protein [Fulvivirgaceae bacterium LMO-SS25]